MPMGVIAKGSQICQPPVVTAVNNPCAQSAATANPAEITPVAKAPAQNTTRDFHSRDDTISMRDRRIMLKLNRRLLGITVSFGGSIGDALGITKDQPRSAKLAQACVGKQQNPLAPRTGLWRYAAMSETYAALHADCAALGTRLFTVSVQDAAAGLARRAYTSHPVEYPVSGTKPLTRDGWYDHCIAGQQTFVANTAPEFAKYFFDHELITSLGLGSCINVPIVEQRHRAGHRESAGRRTALHPGKGWPPITPQSPATTTR